MYQLQLGITIFLFFLLYKNRHVVHVKPVPNNTRTFLFNCASSHILSATCLRHCCCLLLDTLF